jgi:hypothetical protein
VPYSAEVGSRRWSTRYGLKDNLRDDEAAIDAVMGLEPGSFTEPLLIGSEHFVVYVFDVDEDRPVPEEELEKREGELFDPWLTDHRVERSGDISKFPLEGKVPEEPQWFVDSFDQLMQAVPPTFDPAALQVTTTEPEPAPTDDGGAAAP